MWGKTPWRCLNGQSMRDLSWSWWVLEGAFELINMRLWRGQWQQSLTVKVEKELLVDEYNIQLFI